MARVNIDGKIWKDPRVRRLAKRCGWSMRETVGTLAAVWDVAYDLKTEVMNAIDVDTAAELDGFAAHLQAADVELADRHSDTAVRLHGVLERIQYLLAQADRGRAGGLARARKNTDRPSERQANAKRVLSTAQASLKQPPSLPLAPDPSPSPDLALTPTGEGRAPRSPPKRRGAVPPDWHPGGGLDANGERELERFRNHHIAKGNLFVDIGRAWANWISGKFVGSGPPQVPQADIRYGRVEPSGNVYPDGEVEL